MTVNIVKYANALADITRWRIIRLLRDEALCVSELANILEMPQSSVSSHVQVIRKAGLLESAKCQKWTYFRIEGSYLKLLNATEKFLEDNDNELWRDDYRKAAERLGERLESCCPGPKKLTSRKSNILRSKATV